MSRETEQAAFARLAERAEARRDEALDYYARRERQAQRIGWRGRAVAAVLLALLAVGLYVLIALALAVRGDKAKPAPTSEQVCERNARGACRNHAVMSLEAITAQLAGPAPDARERVIDGIYRAVGGLNDALLQGAAGALIHTLRRIERLYALVHRVRYELIQGDSNGS